MASHDGEGSRGLQIASGLLAAYAVGVTMVARTQATQIRDLEAAKAQSSESLSIRREKVVTSDRNAKGGATSDVQKGTAGKNRSSRTVRDIDRGDPIDATATETALRRFMYG